MVQTSPLAVFMVVASVQSGDTDPAVAKVAVTELFEDITKLQEPAPEQAPDQPVNISVPDGVAVNETVVLSATEALQVEPQLMPLPETVPLPVPFLFTVRV